MNDPILKGKGASIAGGYSQLLHPRKFQNIPNNISHVVVVYLQLIWDLKNDKGSKVIFAQGILENTRSLFSSEMQYKDKFWKEHCALNLREFISYLLPEDYRRAIKGIPDTEEDPQTGSFSILYRISTNYLSDVVHFRPEAALRIAREFYKTENDDELFEIMCIRLIYELYNLFCRYSYTAVR